MMRTKSPRRNMGPISKADANKFSDAKVNELMSKKVSSPLMKKILAYADISSIIKEPGDTLQEDVGEDSFNPPLHSTAVYTDEDDPLLTNGSDQMPAKLSSPVAPVVQEKSVKSKKKPAANTQHGAHGPEPAEPRRTPQKKVPVPEPLFAKKPGTPRNMAHGALPSLKAPETTLNRNVSPQKREQLASEPGPSKKHKTSRNLADGAPPTSQAPKTTPNRSVVSAKKSKSHGKDQNTSHRKKSRKENMELAPEDNWSPEDMPKFVKSVNELDVVHFECGKLIEFYREKVDTDVCKKAVDVFTHSFNEQLYTKILDIRKLKDLKRENAKMQSEIGRKRKRLLEVKSEIIAKRAKLNEIQKEYSELKKKRESRRRARTFFYDLAHLQDVYLMFKAKKPMKRVEETYGASSLPALCLEAGNILKAEQHLHIVNRKLQSRE